MVVWTTLGYNKYSRLFEPIESAGTDGKEQKKAEQAGPAAVALNASPSDSASSTNKARQARQFRFKPDLSALVSPAANALVEGTDIHAIHNGCVSVTPLRTTFAPDEVSSAIEVGEKGLWKL